MVKTKLGKKGQGNLGNILVAVALGIILLSVIASMIAESGQADYLCLNEDSYPYLNESEALCYNQTIQENASSEPATDISISGVEFTILGLAVLLLALGLLISVMKASGIKKK